MKCTKSRARTAAAGVCVVLLTVLDQFTKWLAVRQLMDRPPAILIPGILGRDMERQHILPTLLSLGIVTMLTRLAVIAIHMF